MSRNALARRTAPWHARRATIYVLTLGTALVVAVLAFAALMSVRVQRRRASDLADGIRAELYAKAAVDMARYRMKHEANWRDQMKQGTWESDQPIGDGYYSFQAVDPADGDLTGSADGDPANDPVEITGTGKSGPVAKQQIRVTVWPEVAPLGCLEVALHAGNDLKFVDATVYGDEIISANNTIQAEGTCTIYPAAEAVNGFSGVIEPGETTPGIEPRTMPDPNSVFDYYLDHGTQLSIPDNKIEKAKLSPDNNPYGAGNTNPEGIYVVNCEEPNISVQEMEIVGTLVLLDPGAGSSIKDQVNWEPAVAGYPALLVDGDMTFNSTTGLAGLVYVSGNLDVKNSAEIEGVVVTGGGFTCTQSSELTLTYEGIPRSSPPPGFRGPLQLRISPGSWRKVVGAGP